MTSKLKFLFIIIFLSFAFGAYAQNEGDRVVAVIGDDVILESDFQYQVQLYARQNGLNEIPPQVAQQIFQQMVTDKIIYAKALQDSLEVTAEEVNRELDYRIQSLTQQIGSVERVEEVYGMSIGRIKLSMRDDLEKKILADKLKRQHFSGAIKVSDSEVRQFFTTYRDSLPAAPTEFELSQIFISRKISDAEKRAAMETAEKILDSIRAGVDFGELARRNSSDLGSAQNGGDLGPAGKGVFVKEFEDAVFSLKEGQVSEPVATEFGVHIIRLDSRTADIVKARHILIPYPRLESSDFETISFLKDLKSKINSGSISFDSAAFQYSMDQTAKTNKGYLGFVALDQLDSTEIEAIKYLSPGEISDPVKVGGEKSYGYTILKLYGSSQEHPLSLETDYERIKQYAQYFKENKELEKWINELRESIYVDIRY